MCSTTRLMRSSSCGGIGSCRTGLTSRAGRSARATTSTRIWEPSGSTNNKTRGGRTDPRRREERMETGLRLCAIAAAMSLAAGAPGAAAEVPKRGGILTYMIAADAPPSFDAHREGTFATMHSAAPFYSVLIRVNPDNPGSATDFVCDLCTEMPEPADEGLTYAFKIREGVKFHDGSPLSAGDVAASWQHIIFP